MYQGIIIIIMIIMTTRVSASGPAPSLSALGPVNPALLSYCYSNLNKRTAVPGYNERFCRGAMECRVLVRFLLLRRDGVDFFQNICVFSFKYANIKKNLSFKIKLKNYLTVESITDIFENAKYKAN